MHEKTINKIEEEIRGLPEVLEISTKKLQKKDKIILTRDRRRQKNYLSGLQKRISTDKIYIETEEEIFSITLNSKIYSNKFVALKNKFDTIINRYEDSFNATHDKLTEIYNRNGFETEIKKLRGEKYVTVCIADIDNFKQINDTYSHDFGDDVLKRFAENLKNSCIDQASSKKIIFSRYGGEEFVIAVISDEPDVNTPEKIRKGTRGSLESVEFRCSMGFSGLEVPEKINMPLIRTLYKEADAALYKSKREGKDRSTNFKDIRQKLGKIIEIDINHKIVTIDIGKNTGVIEEDIFHVYPYKYSGREKFIIDDGRSKKPIGTYPKIKIAEARPFEIQEEISFCRLTFGFYEKIEVGDCLELTSNDEVNMDD